MIDRLVEHTKQMESYFKLFYDVIDEQRKTILQKEYELKADMDQMEAEMSRLLTTTKKYSMVELYAEKDSIQD